MKLVKCENCKKHFEISNVEYNVYKELEEIPHMYCDDCMSEVYKLTEEVEE